MSVTNGPMSATDISLYPFGDPCSTSYPYYVSTGGDTIRVSNSRNVTLTAAGNPGEICWRPFTVLGVTTYWLCVCVAPNTWRGTALNNLPI